MSGHNKSQSMESWRNNTVKIMVCTTAFGMGIDQPDVEVVMRVGCPPTLESMVQEFGRAGRDGRPAKGKLMHQSLLASLLKTGILFYHENNLQHASFWSKSNTDAVTLYSESWR